MAKFCTECGSPIQKENRFCMNCGNPVPQINPDITACANEKCINDEPKQISAPKRRSRKKVIAFLLIFSLLFTGFFKPGFLRKRTKPSGDTSEHATEQPLKINSDIPEGNSKALSYYACDGVYVSAPENAFEKDTTIKIEPLSEVTRPVSDTIKELEANGEFMIAALEVNAGLEDDEIMPGSYEVSVDLKTFEIPESLYDNLRVYRIADDGSYYELVSAVESGKLVYRSDQNSVVGIVARVVIYGALIYWGYQVYEAQSEEPVKYFYDSKKRRFTYEGKNAYASYRINWSMEDIGIDYDDKVRQLEQITKKYIDQADQLYREYEDEQLFNASNILSILRQRSLRSKFLTKESRRIRSIRK